jgi:hypothetical protein
MLLSRGVRSDIEDKVGRFSSPVEIVDRCFPNHILAIHRYQDGRTAVDTAIFHKKKDCLVLLLMAGASFNSSAENFRSLCPIDGIPDAVARALTHDSNVLLAACIVNDLTFVRYFVHHWKGRSRGSDFLLSILTRPVGPDQRTPLMQAVLADSLPIVEFFRSICDELFPNDVDRVLRATDASGRSAFGLARDKGNSCF